VKIYIETDLEGASGVWKAEQVRPASGGEYEYGKRCLVRDVNEVVDAAFANGATEIIVRDGHGPGALNWDQVDGRVSIERRGSLPMVFPSLDETCDCVFMIGAHAMAGTAAAFLEHTQNSREWYDFKLNGQSQGEVGQFAAYAGHYGVPLALVTGDRALCAEIGRLFPDAVTAEVKKAAFRDQCTCYPAETVRKLLRERTAQAMQKVREGKLKPWVLDKPVELELVYQRVETADRGPQELRVGPRTFRKRVQDQRLVVTILGPTSWLDRQAPAEDGD